MSVHREKKWDELLWEAAISPQPRSNHFNLRSRNVFCRGIGLLNPCEALERRILFNTTTINWTSVNQTIAGFGASSAWTTQGVSASQQQLLFSTTDGAGISLLRSRINEDNTTLAPSEPQPAGSYEIGTMQAAAAMGVTVWSTPWSPPAAWKTNGSVDNGGSLLTGTDRTTGLTYYQEYANYLAQYVVTMKGDGIPIYGISLQNEADISTGYDSCLWTAADFANFLPDVVSAFNAYGVSGTKIIMPEETGWHFELANTVMNTPALNADVSVYAAHDYDGGSGMVPGAAGKQLWMTEVYDGNNSDTGILSGLWVAQNIYNMVVNSGVNAYDYWWIQSGSASGNGQLLGPNWGQTQLFWGLANYSKFIRPGWNNIGETNDGGLTSSAYADTATGQFATVLINSSTSPITENIDISGAYSSVLTPWVTSSTLNLAQQTPIPATGSGNAFTYTIPAQSIVTLMGSATTTPVTAPPVGLTATPSGTTGVTLLWSRNLTNATGYAVQRSTDEINWATLNSTVSSTTYSYNDSSLSPNTLYYYRVIANNGSVYSNVSYSMTLPQPPTNLTASYSFSTKDVTLDWTTSGATNVDYDVDRSTDGGNTWLVLNAGLSHSTSSYVDTAPPQGAAVEYQVEAVYGGNASVTATQTIATSLQPPTQVTVKAVSGGATLNWTNSPASSGASVIVQQSIDGSSAWKTLATLASGVSSYTDTTAIASGTTYSYRLQSALSGSVSSYSSTVSITINNVTGTILQLIPANGSNSFYLKKDSDGVHLDIWENSAAPGSGTPTQQAVLGSISEVSVLGGTSGNTLTIDYANGDPFPTGGVAFSDTVGTNGVTIANIPAVDSVTAKDSLIMLNADAFYFTDLQSLGLNFSTGSSTLLSTAPILTPILTTQIPAATTLMLAAANSMPITAVFNVSSGGILNLNGQSESIDQLWGAGTVTSTGGTLSIGASNSSSSFSGTLTGSLSLDKIGTGTFTMSGNNLYSGSTVVDFGTILVNGGTLGTSSATIGIAPGDADSGTLGITGSAVVNASFIFDGCDGIDNAGGGVGYLNQSGGTINDRGAIWLGGASTVANGAYGNYRISGGVGSFSGGINMSINQNSDSHLDVSGGQVNILNNSSIQMGSFYSPPATFTQTGGTVTFYKDNGTTVGGTGSLILGSGGGSALIANLDGGTFIVPGVTSTSGAPMLNLDGGTLEAAAASNSFIASTVTTNVEAGGAIFNSNGFPVIINQPLLHFGSGIDGGLTLDDTAVNSGTLTLDAAETYTGPTTVIRGTLGLSFNPGDSTTGTLEAGTTVNVNQGGTLVLNVEDALGYYGGSLAVLNINGGTVTTANVANPFPVQDSGGTSFRVTLPPVVFSGGTLSSGNNNDGDTYGGSFLIGSVTTLPNSTTAVINAYSLSVQSPATINVGSGTTTSGVDLQVSSIVKTWAPVTTGLVKTGAGLLELTATNTYTNNTLISSGTLQLGDGQASDGSISGNIVDDGTLAISNPTAQTLSNTIIGTGGVNKAGAGTLTFSASSTYSGPTNISSGTLVLGSTASIADSTTINVNFGSSFNLAASTSSGILIRDLGDLNVNSGGTVLVSSAANHSNRQLLVLTGLFITSTSGTFTGLINLTNNDLDVQSAGSGGLALLSAAVAQGFNPTGRPWQGSEGITSSTAASDLKYLTAIGCILNSTTALAGGATLYGWNTSFGTFDGISPSATDALLKLTYFGDTNLDGKVDGSDYSRIDNGYLARLSGWQNGDFNYDGAVNGSDYTLIDNAFNTQGAILAAQITTPKVAATAGPSVTLTNYSTTAFQVTPSSITAANRTSLIATIPALIHRDRPGEILTDVHYAASVAPTIYSTARIRLQLSRRWARFSDIDRDLPDFDPVDEWHRVPSPNVN